MSTNHLLVWNARGLNNRARRNVVRDVAEQQRASIVCLQETKVANLSASMNADLTGAGFDFACLPAIGVAGGAVTSWRRDLWSVSSSCVRRFSVTVKLSPADGHAEPWWLTNVYGPATRAGKPDFFQELRDINASCPSAWLVCGDFNIIYLASDKNSGRLHRGLMRRFRSLIDDLQLEELTLSGRLFTWSNGRDQPTLEYLDRAFATVEWLERQHLCPSDESVLLDWWQQERMRVPESFRRGFDSLVLLVSWEVWKERNRRTFDSSCKTPTELVSLIRHEANDWIAAGFRSFAPLFTPAA